MSQLDQILAVLQGEKRFDGAKWVSHDAAGTPLVDLGGVLWRGLHGWLLQKSNVFEQAPVVEPGFAGGMTWRPYKRRPREEEEALLLAVLH